MRVPVEVTARDIKLGTNKTVNSCPLGRAIKRALGLRGKRASKLIIDIEEVMYIVGDGLYGEETTLARFPAKVFAWMERWDGWEGDDEGKPVAPFSFNLNVREGALKKAGIVLS